ncbi:MAG: adenosylcobalamin-dependent ribonucleoside-diphosphate reductase, partial [Ghiorsea sp.]|nr:adenosylcobalamin-dependent ribonucleoside-diphosphate reductase [Ghiorsea sp.]
MYKIDLQPASQDIWGKKYQLKDKRENPVDTSVDDTLKRVAKALSSNEERGEYWYKKFLWAMENGAFPAGRILANAGAGKYKPATSTINCTVSPVILDSMESILQSNKLAGQTLKAGCGIGYEFSTLRPKGSFVGGSGSSTSGPLPFMDIYDVMCKTISSAGDRRGAQMATFDVSHPDVFDFIKAKREDGRLRQFNLSCLITKDFMQAVKEDATWDLYFPLLKGEGDKGDFKTVYKKVANAGLHGYPVNKDGLTECRVYKTIKAKALWNVIMSSTFDYAEPGFILIDEVNRQNNNWFCEDIRATNPCGEVPLPPYGSCLLGSVNLTRFVLHPFTSKACFDYALFEKVVAVFTRMLDNVVEVNGLPLVQQRKEIIAKRRHGMGYLGLGSALTMMGVRYGSEESIAFTEAVSSVLAIVGFEEGVKLAKEKGCAPILANKWKLTPEIKRGLVERGAEHVFASNKVEVRGLELWVESHYMQSLIASLGKRGEKLKANLLKYGCRFTHHTAIAPTGTIALSLGNNASNGIEPSYAHEYSRNIIREGQKAKEKVSVRSYELMLY